MPKIIVTSTYRKGGGGGKKGGAGGLLKYIGTREGVEKLPLSQTKAPATKQQKSLIESVIKRIPDATQYPEYQEFLKAETKGTAIKFLNAVLKQEEAAERIGKLVSYMAERPGVVKLGKHGLFSQTDDPINLDKAAEEVANHEGYIWTHIVSLHREDAERLGYNNAEAWKSLVRRNVTSIAEAHRIPLSDLQWYAAFHDTGHHPHIHLLVYSKGQEGYLSKQSIDTLRSSFGNVIFHQEQYHLFQLQTGLRDDIKEKSEQKIRDLIAQAETESVPNEQLQFLFVKLRKQLDQHKGKKVYGYLPKQIKATVNEIVSHLATEPAIEELYKEWNNVNREKLSLYYENIDATVPLVDNKEFRSIKNMIIKAVMELPPDVEVTHSEASKEDSDEESIRIHLRVYEENPVLNIPEVSGSAPIVIQPNITEHRDTLAAIREIIGALARLIGNKCMDHHQVLQGQIDHRLKQQINEKKLALGLKTEVTQKASYQTEEEYEQSM